MCLLLLPCHQMSSEVQILKWKMWRKALPTGECCRLQVVMFGESGVPEGTISQLSLEHLPSMDDENGKMVVPGSATRASG